PGLACGRAGGNAGGRKAVGRRWRFRPSSCVVMEVSGVSVCGLPVRCGPVVVGQGGAAAAARRFPLAQGGCSPELPWPMILTRGPRKARARRAARGFDALEGQPAVFRLSRYGEDGTCVDGFGCSWV